MKKDLSECTRLARLILEFVERRSPEEIAAFFNQ
jgi:hypothetical protein